MSKFSVIWKEAYLRNVKSMGYILLVLLPLILAGGGILVGTYLAGENQQASQRTISIVASQEMKEMIVQQAPSYQYKDVADEKEAVDLLADQSIDGYLVVNQSSEALQAVFTTSKDGKDVDVTPLNKALSAINLQNVATALHVSANDVQKLSATQVNVDVNKLSKEALTNRDSQFDQAKADRENQVSVFKLVIAYGVLMIVYIFATFYAQLMVQEIGTEKGTRIVEVVLSSAKATDHLLGKLFAAGLLLLTHIAIYVLVFVGIYVFTDMLSSLQVLLGQFDLWKEFGLALTVSGLCILLAVMTYITIAAFLGSIVSKVEDAQKVMSPLVIVSIIGLYIGMFATTMPNHIVVKISSYVPLIAPMLLPFRLVSGSVSMLEIGASLASMAITVAIIVYVTAHFYRSNMLSYSEKGILQVLKQSWGILRNEKK